MDAVQRTLSNESKHFNNTLGLILDENGVILCKGRLENSELTSSQINPILIPGNHAFARLLVLDAHLKTSHGGKKDTITQLRSKYWVTKGRNLVHRVLHNCPRPCRRLEGKSFKSVESPQLPSFRVRQSFPFCNTGCDYLGPLLVRQVFDGSQMGMYKVWVVLYTCAVTRAVHLDLVPDLSASSFIRSLKRFIGRRGVPNLMMSDNASCFRNEEVKLNEELLHMQVKWKFIVEGSPWWGGFWERLVQTVKRSLRKILFRASVNYEELQTIIVEIEGIVNSRPLTYIYDDSVEEILTPSHLLLGRRLLSKFEEDFDDGNEVDNTVLTKRMKHLKSLSESFWSRFKEEYLLELRAQHVQGNDPSRTPEIGEIVVVEGKSKRNSWKLGKIVSFLVGSDGRRRSAVLKTFDGERGRYIKRPIERLYPVEVKSKLDVTQEEIEYSKTDNAISPHNEQPIYETRPTRVAAEAGILKRRLAEHS